MQKNLETSSPCHHSSVKIVNQIIKSYRYHIVITSHQRVLFPLFLNAYLQPKVTLQTLQRHFILTASSRAHELFLQHGGMPHQSG